MSFEDMMMVFCRLVFLFMVTYKLKRISFENGKKRITKRMSVKMGYNTF